MSKRVDIQRNYSLDLIRVLACVMVVLMHSPFPSKNAIGPLYSAISYFTSPCIGLFIMISGALLLPTKTGLILFIKRRLDKLLIPTVIWTIIYLLLSVGSGQVEANSILKHLLSIPFSPQGHGVLWFMYTLLGLYLVAPIISPWLRKNDVREVELVICLWFLTLCFPVLEKWLFIRNDVYGSLYYFTGFGGYFICGYYFSKYKKAINKAILLPALAISLFIPLLNKLFNINLGRDALWYLGPFTAILTISIYQFLGLSWGQKINRYISNKVAVRSIIVACSKYSFAVYLIHIAVMRYFLWNLSWFTNISNCVIQLSISFSFTIFVSYLLSIYIGKLPFSKYLFAS